MILQLQEQSFNKKDLQTLRVQTAFLSMPTRTQENIHRVKSKIFQCISGSTRMMMERWQKYEYSSEVGLCYLRMPSTPVNFSITSCRTMRRMSSVMAMPMMFSLVASGNQTLGIADENSMPHINKVLPDWAQEIALQSIQISKRLMIQIANVPYRKIYKFPLFSDSMALVLITYTFIVLASFFMVYSVHNFYLSSVDQITVNPSLSFSYQYHLTIQTTQSVYVYTNIFQQQTAKAITFSYLEDSDNLVHNFNIQWEKPMSEAVTKASLLVLMKYNTESVEGAIGMVLGEGRGANIADLNIVGLVQMKEGSDLTTPPPTTSILPQNDYDIQKTLIALEQNYDTYLSFKTTRTVNNLPTNLFTMNFVLKSETHSLKAATPSILGQLIWSWGQFFPVAFIFWLVATWGLSFCFRQNLINRTVKHEGRVIF